MNDNDKVGNYESAAPENQFNRRRIQQFYVFKPLSSYQLAFKRGYPLIRKVETQLSKRAYRNLNES